MPESPSREDTKHRLINAAGEIFAEKGFHAASVREICDKADANIASVNYHFGSKEKLYEAVVLHTFSHAMEKYPRDFEREKESTAEERLFLFVERLLLQCLDQDRPAWHIKVHRREFAEPGPALQALVQKGIRKNFEELSSIMTDIVGTGVDREHLQLCLRSIVGQCLFYHFGKPVIFQLFGPLDYSSAGIRKLARHITDFSLAAIRNMKGH